MIFAKKDNKYLPNLITYNKRSLKNHDISSDHFIIYLQVRQDYTIYLCFALGFSQEIKVFLKSQKYLV